MRVWWVIAVVVALAGCGDGGSQETLVLDLRLLTEDPVEGTPVALLVSVMRDGEPAEDYRGEIRFRTTDPSAFFPATYIFGRADRGARFFPIQFSFGLGTHQLVADGEDFESPAVLMLDVKPDPNPKPAQIGPVATPPTSGPRTIYRVEGARARIAGTTNLKLADVDLDGDVDLLVTGSGPYPSANGGYGTTTLLLNVGTGAFVATRQQFGSTTVHDAAFGDVDGDGAPDLILAREELELWINDGRGGFSKSGDLVPGNGPVLADVDGDGDLDLVAATKDVGFSILKNDGDGGFTTTQSESGDGYHAPVLGDLDGDGDLDLIAQRGFWLNDGAGSFVHDGQDLRGNVTALALGDLDGDGDLDLLSGNYMSINVLYFNDGDGNLTMTTSGLPGEPLCTVAIAVIDVDEDGDLDLLEGNQSAWGVVWINDGDGSFDALEEDIGGFVGVRIATGDTDGDGDTDVLTLASLDTLWYRNE